MHVDQADAVAQRQVDQLLPPPPTQWHQERNLEATRPSEHFPLQETDSSSPSTIYTGGRSSIDQTTLVGPVPRRVYQWPPPSPSLRPKSTLEALGQSEHLSCQDAKRDDPSMISTGAKPSGSRTTDLEGNPELLSLGVPLKALGKVPQTSGPSLPDHGSIHTVTECLSGAQKTDSMDVDSQGPSWRSSAPNPYFREMQTARNTHQHGWVRTLISSEGDLAYRNTFLDSHRSWDRPNHRDHHQSSTGLQSTRESFSLQYSTAPSVVSVALLLRGMRLTLHNTGTMHSPSRDTFPQAVSMFRLW